MRMQVGTGIARLRVLGRGSAPDKRQTQTA